jgi:hypothetical protein
MDKELISNAVAIESGLFFLCGESGLEVPRKISKGEKKIKLLGFVRYVQKREDDFCDRPTFIR